MTHQRNWTSKDNMKVVVAFSSGTDSVSALIDSISKYGKENVRAYMIDVIYKEDQSFKLHEAQVFYAKKICEYLDVELIIDKQLLVTKGHKVFPDIYQWAHCLLMYCIANLEITKAVYGHSADDTTHKHVILWRDIFARCMEAQNRDVTLEYPLIHLSKKECFEMIPDEIKEYVWTCTHPLGTVQGKHGIKRYVPCGKCGKCTEFNTKVY